MGFLGELIASTRSHEPDYAIRDQL